MRPLVVVLLVLLAPAIAAVGSQTDPVGDQRTYARATSFGDSAELGDLCSDPATDMVTLELVSLNETAEVRLRVADAASSLPTCAGEDILVPYARGFQVDGTTADGRPMHLWADGVTPDDFAGTICGVKTANGTCWSSGASFHREGDVLVWTFSLIAEPLEWFPEFPGFDLRGVNVTLNASSSTSFPDMVFIAGLTSKVTTVRDATDPLAGTY